MNYEPQNPAEIIHLLQDMEAWSRTYAAPLPLEEEIRSVWSGIGFRIGRHRFVAPMQHVREIMKYPRVSQVPGSKEWVRGIANIRGNLLPIFDLQGFLSGLITPVRRETRVLAINRDKLNAGLIVDEIYGMKHFDQEGFDAHMQYDVQWLDYMKGGYAINGESWVVFNLDKLIENQDFLNVALK